METSKKRSGLGVALFVILILLIVVGMLSRAIYIEGEAEVKKAALAADLATKAQPKASPAPAAPVGCPCDQLPKPAVTVEEKKSVGGHHPAKAEKERPASVAKAPVASAPVPATPYLLLPPPAAPVVNVAKAPPAPEASPESLLKGVDPNFGRQKEALPPLLVKEEKRSEEIAPAPPIENMRVVVVEGDQFSPPPAYYSQYSQPQSYWYNNQNTVVYQDSNGYVGSGYVAPVGGHTVVFGMTQGGESHHEHHHPSHPPGVTTGRAR